MKFKLNVDEITADAIRSFLDKSLYDIDQGQSSVNKAHDAWVEKLKANFLCVISQINDNIGVKL